MKDGAPIFVAGHRGLVGPRSCGGSSEPGSTSCSRPRASSSISAIRRRWNYWFRANRPDYVFLVAGTVGGILANSTRPAEFIYDNIMIHATVVHAAH